MRNAKTLENHLFAVRNARHSYSDLFNKRILGSDPNPRNMRTTRNAKTSVKKEIEKGKTLQIRLNRKLSLAELHHSLKKQI
ncbi:hypothetical protein RJT34_09391 [Clitoria ternatea]|uniref:Uncharacterized protein n=1 Tax=Clitoria ternatea TaxID=43366 RepID=A0AAN9PV39_CLITE